MGKENSKPLLVKRLGTGFKAEENWSERRDSNPPHRIQNHHNRNQFQIHPTGPIHKYAHRFPGRLIQS